MTTSHTHIYGHDWAVNFLRQSLRHERTRHAYLLTGAANIGKSRLAHFFAQALQCEHEDPSARPCGECRSCKRMLSGNHPDILYAEHDEKTGALRIDALRELMRLLALKPFSSRYRIAILEHFDAAQDRAQDALLKTLEEPAPHAVLILLADSPQNLLPTILSRCQHLPLKPTSQASVRLALQAHGADAAQIDLLAPLSNGRIGWALAALQNPAILEDRGQALRMLSEALYGNRRQRFLIAEELSKLDKPFVRYVLEMWQTYWRDAVLRASAADLPLCNIDYESEVNTLAQHFPLNELVAALQATRHCLQDTLFTNANVRLALEVLFLDYPGLLRERS